MSPKPETTRPCQNDLHGSCPYRDKPHKGSLHACYCWCHAATWDEARPRLEYAIRRLRIDAGAELGGGDVCR